MANKYLVQSRIVAVADRFGRRFRKTRWGEWRTWNNYVDNVRNIKEAIGFAKKRLYARHLGSVIYIRLVTNNVASKNVVPIFDVKWGHDDLPYIAWKSNPAADYWQRRVKVAYGSLTE